MTGGSKSVLEQTQYSDILGQGDNKTGSIIELDKALSEGLDFICSHFDYPYFPRAISSFYTGNKQIIIHNKKEALARFKQANGFDCRINAYPALYVERTPNRQAPDLLFVDIDRKRFKNYKDPQKAFNSAVCKTLKNFKEKLPGSCPTVLDTGGGYHFYQPISAPFLLESIPELTKLSREPSREFLKFAEQFLANRKADPCHTPTFRSSLLRVPGSINSTWSKTVTIVQRSNGYRPAINYLLCDFREYLIQQKLNRYHIQQKNAKKYNQRFLPSNNNNNNNSISWIESNILSGNGISDYRKLTINLILANYLINIKKYSYKTAYNTIVEWLDKCAAKRPLTFRVSNIVNYALSHAKTGPMKLDTMKEKYPDMYKEIFEIN